MKKLKNMMTVQASPVLSLCLKGRSECDASKKRKTDTPAEHTEKLKK